ncbi:MAG: family 16 glycoside hydrolase [Bacteroidota bacterium]
MRFTLLLLLLASTCGRAQNFVPLLTDANLSGWHVQIKGKGVVPANQQNIFRWKNKQLRVYAQAKNGAPEPFAALISDSLYQDYHLRLEYRWGTGKYPPRADFVRDAGIVFHVFDTTQFWAGGIECQFQEGDTGDVWLIGSRAGLTKFSSECP